MVFTYQEYARKPRSEDDPAAEVAVPVLRAGRIAEECVSGAGRRPCDAGGRVEFFAVGDGQEDPAPPPAQAGALGRIAAVFNKRAGHGQNQPGSEL